MKDNVNHPTHYNSGKVECIDALESATTGLSGIEAVCTANAIKYLWRWKNKNGTEDLRKARWYLDRLIAVQEDTPVVTPDAPKKGNGWIQVGDAGQCMFITDNICKRIVELFENAKKVDEAFNDADEQVQDHITDLAKKWQKLVDEHRVPDRIRLTAPDGSPLYFTWKEERKDECRENRIYDAMKFVADHRGLDTQMVTCAEELSELIQALSKLRRKTHGQYPETDLSEFYEKVEEEIADALVMIYQMEYLLNLDRDNIFDIYDAKILREKARIEAEQLGIKVEKKEHKE